MKQLLRKKYFGDTLEEEAFFALTLLPINVWLLFSAFCCVAVNYTSFILVEISKGVALSMCLSWTYASTLLGCVFVLSCRNAIRRLGLWKSLLPPLGLIALAVGYGAFTGF